MVVHLGRDAGDERDRRVRRIHQLQIVLVHNRSAGNAIEVLPVRVRDDNVDRILLDQAWDARQIAEDAPLSPGEALQVPEVPPSRRFPRVRRARDMADHVLRGFVGPAVLQIDYVQLDHFRVQTDRLDPHGRSCAPSTDCRRDISCIDPLEPRRQPAPPVRVAAGPVGVRPVFGVDPCGRIYPATLRLGEPDHCGVRCLSGDRRRPGADLWRCGHGSRRRRRRAEPQLRPLLRRHLVGQLR